MVTSPKFHCENCKKVFEDIIWKYMTYLESLGIDNPNISIQNIVDRIVEAITTFSPEMERSEKK